MKYESEQQRLQMEANVKKLEQQKMVSASSYWGFYRGISQYKTDSGKYQPRSKGLGV